MDATKFDSEKAKICLLPTEALREVAKVVGFGATKYGRYNWRQGMDWTRLYDAAQRHLWAWLEGETRDSDSRMRHLAHAACSILFLLSYEITGTGKDDRYGVSHDGKKEGNEEEAQA